MFHVQSHKLVHVSGIHCHEHASLQAVVFLCTYYIDYFCTVLYRVQ